MYRRGPRGTRGGTRGVLLGNTNGCRRGTRGGMCACGCVHACVCERLWWCVVCASVVWVSCAYACVQARIGVCPRACVRTLVRMCACPRIRVLSAPSAFLSAKHFRACVCSTCACVCSERVCMRVRLAAVFACLRWSHRTVARVGCREDVDETYDERAVGCAIWAHVRDRRRRRHLRPRRLPRTLLLQRRVGHHRRRCMPTGLGVARRLLDGTQGVIPGYSREVLAGTRYIYIYIYIYRYRYIDIYI